MARRLNDTKALADRGLPEDQNHSIGVRKIANGFLTVEMTPNGGRETFSAEAPRITPPKVAYARGRPEESRLREAVTYMNSADYVK